jgi:hypothetical protein
MTDPDQRRVARIGHVLAFLRILAVNNRVWLWFVVPTLFSVIPTEVEGSRAGRRDLSVFSTLLSSYLKLPLFHK